MRRREFLRVASGAAGATAAGASAATAQETTTAPGGTEADGAAGTQTGGAGGNQTGENGAGAGGAGGGGGAATVSLVDFAFEPGTEEPLYVTPGTTVTFVWETSTHNIVVDNQPGEADWGGHESIEDAGFEYEHTFEVEGEYEYHCQPHINQGMEGTIVVNQEGAPPVAEGAGEPAIPDSAKTLGIAASVAMSATLGLAYVFLKYGGGRPAEPAE